MNMLKYIVLVVLTAALCGCAPARPKPLAQPESLPIQGPFTHEASGMKFPLQIGDFERRSVLRNDTHGLSVSARYELRSMAVSLVAAVDIYPSQPLDTAGLPAEMVSIARENLSQQTFEARKREIVSSHPGAILVQEGDTASHQQDHPLLGKLAVFEYQATFFREQQVLRSQLYLFGYAGGEWTIQYLITFPRNADALTEVEYFLTNLPWTLKKPKPAGSRK